MKNPTITVFRTLAAPDPHDPDEDYWWVVTSNAGPPYITPRYKGPFGSDTSAMDTRITPERARLFVTLFAALDEEDRP